MITLRKGKLREKLSWKNLKKPHNLLRIFTIIGYVLVMALWLVFNITLLTFLALLLTVMFLRIGFALYLFKKKASKKSLQ